jgi:peroxiredoxin
MSIKVGDKVPEATLKRLTAEGMSAVETAELFGGRKVVLFSIPGAYTPTCHRSHLPGFIARADEIKAKGVAEIVCLAVNDPFVLKAWGAELGADGKVTLLSDWDAAFVTAMGLEQDISVAALGIRGKRFTMTVNDGVVEALDVEPGKDLTVSGADHCVANLS